MHRYESDLTPKEKRQMEIEKIKSLSFPKKVEHMWAYHKFILASPIILVLLIVLAHGWIQNMRTDQVLNIGISNGFETDTEWLVNVTEERLNIDNPFSEVMVDTSYITIDGEFDINSIQKFTVMIAAGGLDIFISNPRMYENYKGQELFMNMNEIFSEEELSEMSLVNNYAIEITHYPVVIERLNLFYDRIYLMVISNVELDVENHDGRTKRELIREFYRVVIAGQP